MDNDLIKEYIFNLNMEIKKLSEIIEKTLICDDCNKLRKYKEQIK